MNFIFFGTPDVARDTLAHLLDVGLTPSLVVTNPDAPIGRKQVITPSPVKVLAIENNIRVLMPERLDEGFVQEVGAGGADLAIVVAYGKILPKSLIESFPKGVLNIHYSLLPKYRGASPVESALLNDEKETGVTIQKMIYELDAGDIVAELALPIQPDDTTDALRAKLIKLGSKLLINILPGFLAGKIVLTPQNHTEASFSRKLKKEDGLLELTTSGQKNWNKYRAFYVWPGTFFFRDSKRYKITKAHFENGKFIVERVIPEGKKEQEFIY